MLNVLERAGIPRRKRGTAKGYRPKLPIPKEEVARRYLAGESAPVLGAAIGVSQTTIYHVLDDLGIPRRSPQVELKKRNQAERAARLKKAGPRKGGTP